MVQELLPFLPSALTTEQAAGCVAGIAVGAVLWLAGAIWSRGIVTLLAVAAGGTLGLVVPRWQNWPMNAMSASVLGAVLLGVFAFVLPRIWVGLLLGVVLACWVALAAWMLCRAGQGWIWRQQWEVENMILPEHLHDMWLRLPETVRRVLPYGAGGALLSGVSLSMLFPRLARVTCFAVTGVTIVFLSALVLVASRRPDWLGRIPPDTLTQAGILTGLALIGMLLQWQLLPSRKSAAQPEERTEEPPAVAAGPHKFA